MPTGIARSLFTSKFARALGWRISKVRELYNRQGYNSPYTDIDRALRIHKAQGHDIPKLLRAVNRRYDDVDWGDPALEAPPPPPLHPPPTGNALVLTHAPSQPPPTNGAEHPPVQHHADMRMLARLARATPEGDTPENQLRIKKTLNSNGFDLRNKNESRAVDILRQHGFTVMQVQPRDSPVRVDSDDNGSFPDIDSLGPAQLRELCRELIDQNNRLTVDLSSRNIRLTKVERILTMSHDRLVEQIRNTSGPIRISPAENAAVDALHAVERQFKED